MYPLRLAQNHLTLLETCPRKFQHWVLDQLGIPEAVEQQERLRQGARFHLLLQQWLMALPIAPMLQADKQLHQWMEAFQAAAPQILDEGVQQPESDRLLEWAGYLLTVRYDLLILGNEHAKILDWKTSTRPKQAQKLEHHWQTRLYRFVLAETSRYLPEQISMVYWFFQSNPQDGTPHSLTFQYNSRKHEETRQDLQRLLSQLTEWLTQYQAGQAFPQVGWGSPQCEDCSFAARCERAIAPARQEWDEHEREAGDRDFWQLPTLAEIAEVPLES
ncbi:MAG: PD-(D/E)XK nuclease family protein [Leptolyngbyaceae cyanobacterium bins.349]|nr:PD-(D/E)XK nuclease family protein [Leptolyngbyaceae cyanobacterium bins.349]